MIEETNQLTVDDKYLQLLGFNEGRDMPSLTPKMVNFSIVTYALGNQLASAVEMAKNVNLNLPSEHLLIYDLGLSEDDQHTLQKYCFPVGNGSSSSPTTTSSSSSSPPFSPQQITMPVASSTISAAAASSLTTVSGLTYNTSKCFLVKFDVLATSFPSFVIDDSQMHAYRPLIIKDALRKAKAILFMENSVRVRPNVLSDLTELRLTAEESGVKGWRTKTPQAVSSITHPKMYDYFHTDDDNFKFLKMISMDSVFFVDRSLVTEKILLPWIKCALTPECIHPIGEQLNAVCVLFCYL